MLRSARPGDPRQNPLLVAALSELFGLRKERCMKTDTGHEK